MQGPLLVFGELGPHARMPQHLPADGRVPGAHRLRSPLGLREGGWLSTGSMSRTPGASAVTSGACLGAPWLPRPAPPPAHTSAHISLTALAVKWGGQSWGTHTQAHKSPSPGRRCECWPPRCFLSFHVATSQWGCQSKLPGGTVCLCAPARVSPPHLPSPLCAPPRDRRGQDWTAQVSHQHQAPSLRAFGERPALLGTPARTRAVGLAEREPVPGVPRGHGSPQPTERVLTGRGATTQARQSLLTQSPAGIPG